MATIILELDTDLEEDIAGVRDAVQAIADLISFNSAVHVPSERSTAAKAREIAETVTLDDEEHPEYGYQPVIRDIDQLAAFIDDGIRSYLGLPTGVYEPK